MKKAEKMVGCYYAFFALIALSFVLAVESESSSRDVAAWNWAYDRVFGEMKWESYEKYVIRRMMLMHSKLSKVEGAIDQAKRDNFKFWYDAMSDTNKDNCHVSHIEALYNKLEIPKNKNKPNLKKLFTVVHKNLVDVCSDVVSQLADEIEKQFKPLRQRYIDIKVDYVLFHQGSKNEKVFVLDLLYILDLDTKSRKKVEEAWEKGPCPKLLTLVRQPHMKPWYEFARLNWYNGFGQAGWCPYKTNLYSMATMVCEDLETKFPEYLDKYITGSKVFRRKVGSFWNGRAYWA